MEPGCPSGQLGHQGKCTAAALSRNVSGRLHSSKVSPEMCLGDCMAVRSHRKCVWEIAWLQGLTGNASGRLHGCKVSQEIYQVDCMTVKSHNKCI